MSQCRAASAVEIRGAIRGMAEEVGARMEKTLREIAVPKPSRASEHYAALTLAIVLLRELIMPENTPADRKRAVERELEQLLKKRAELEDQLDPQIGGS